MPARMHGFALWFDVRFTTDGPELRLGTGPEDEYAPLTLCRHLSALTACRPTHWAQTVVYLSEAVALKQDDCVQGEFRFSRHSTGRGLQFDFSFAVNEEEPKRQSCKMPW